MNIPIDEVEELQVALFRRLQSELLEAEKKDYYLTGRDILQYTQTISNLENMKSYCNAE